MKMSMDTYASERRQTAFRLDKELLYLLKRRAKRQNKTLNTLVEETLRKSVADEMDGWPLIEGPVEVSEEVRKWHLKKILTAEEIAADDRLQYILGK